MKAEDIKRHFEGNGRNAVFVFEENFVARDEILKLDLGPDFEIVEYKDDAFALKHKIRTLPLGKRIVVVVDKPSPLATGRDASKFPLLSELMANGELEAETPQSFMMAKGLDVSDQSLASFVEKHLSEMTTAAAELVFADSFSDGFTVATAARGLASVNLGSNTMRRRLRIQRRNQSQHFFSIRRTAMFWQRSYGNVCGCSALSRGCRPDQRSDNADFSPVPPNGLSTILLRVRWQRQVKTRILAS